MENITQNINNLHFSFPAIPDSLSNEYGIHQLLLRSFGKSEMDINIDFHQSRRPYLVTQILQVCTENNIGNGKFTDINEDFFWSLTVSKRIEALLGIAISGGTTGLTLQFCCSNQSCGEFIEMEITQDEILKETSTGTEMENFTILVNGTEYLFRKPTGNDQLRWLSEIFSFKKPALEIMIRDLLISPKLKKNENEILEELEIKHEFINAVEKGMEMIDPLIYFNLTACCPACNKDTNKVFDLENLLLQRLHKIQLNLLDSIHCLALHYHWSEQQILEIPPPRRSYYIAQIEKGNNNILR